MLPLHTRPGSLPIDVLLQSAEVSRSCAYEQKLPICV